ncbi:MAG: dTMP kinase [Candidatus Eisenbacteria bacterium]|nr:dTMP kinase [Candidatus Eisenbacteria bacterium]
MVGGGKDGSLAQLRGKLFIVEGVDGSGKSTQIDLLHKWLVSQGYLVVFTEWNSSPIVKATTRRGKREKLLTPMSFSLIHAADFASRVHMQILPALEAGAIVLADRYVYTAYARDGVRGVNREWLRELYSFAPAPTLAFYFDVPLTEAIRRILEGRPALKWYEAGMDLGLSEDPYQSFQIFQGMIRAEYDRIVDEHKLIRIDATQHLIKQQQRVRDAVMPHLRDVLRVDSGSVHTALSQTGLLGRYLDAPATPAEEDV